MRLDEITISKAIATSFLEKFKECMEADVVVARLLIGRLRGK